MRPLRGLQENRVATREESGVLGFPSRRRLSDYTTLLLLLKEGLLQAPSTALLRAPRARPVAFLAVQVDSLTVSRDTATSVRDHTAASLNTSTSTAVRKVPLSSLVNKAGRLPWCLSIPLSLIGDYPHPPKNPATKKWHCCCTEVWYYQPHATGKWIKMPLTQQIKLTVK